MRNVAIQLDGFVASRLAMTVQMLADVGMVRTSSGMHRRNRERPFSQPEFV